MNRLIFLIGIAVCSYGVYSLRTMLDIENSQQPQISRPIIEGNTFEGTTSEIQTAVQGIDNPINLVADPDGKTIEPPVVVDGEPASIQMDMQGHILVDTTGGRDDLLRVLKTIPPDSLILIGYVGEDGDVHALKEQDLKCHSASVGTPERTEP